MFSDLRLRRFVIVQNSIKTIYLFRLSYIKKLVNYGEVVIIAPVDDDYFKNKLLELGVKVYNVPPLDSKLNKVVSIFKINCFILIERFKGSSFICHFLITFLISYFSLVPFNKKLIIYTEGLGTLFTKSIGFRRVLKKLIINNNSIRLFCNESERNLIGRDIDIVTNGIGVDINKFIVPLNKSSNSRTYNIIYVGRLIKDKGIIDAIYVLRELLKKNRNVKLIIVGDVYLNNPSSLKYDDINRFKKEFKDAIEFKGFSKNILDEYKRSDILIIPSIREGFPVCVMEACSMGIPSVGYKVPGVEDAIKNNINGLLSEYGDFKQLSEQVDSLLNNEKLYEYRYKCRKYSEENFSRDEKDNFIINLMLNNYSS
ncbi:TPA: glycosyltransferase [Photobacterium damselae]